MLPNLILSNEKSSHKLSELISVAFREYLDNIKLVDDGVERMEEVIEEFFDYDGKTVYVFTSDHGMTDWGNLKRCILF
jgi:arylsulfatase A-like enzyme